MDAYKLAVLIFIVLNANVFGQGDPIGNDNADGNILSENSGVGNSPSNNDTELVKDNNVVQFGSERNRALNDDPLHGQKMDLETVSSDSSDNTNRTTTEASNDPAHIEGRVLSDTYQSITEPYVITDERLRQIRGDFLYWFYDQGGSEKTGDYQTDIGTHISQIHKNLNFELPFFGFRFNYTRVSLDGYVYFSDPPAWFTYPLNFPNRHWPSEKDPSFIGIFFSKCRIGRQNPEDPDQRRPGVYFRVDRDLQNRTDQLGVEMRERITWDIREGVIGADNFFPKHAITVTWKNVSFAGGIDSSLFVTNTFQMVLATDEVFTYAIFNYLEINWTTHSEAGGDTTNGQGGVPAYVGFNAGNGTQSYVYNPYSQSPVIRDLTSRGWVNGFPGRHIFRIDEKILSGSCNKHLHGASLPLTFAPESGNMLGGTIVNITGPCFEPSDRIICRFGTEAVIAVVVNRNRAVCIQPRLWYNGYVKLQVAINNVPYKWEGKFYVETPTMAVERIFFSDNSVHERYPTEILIKWDPHNLTSILQAPMQISLWGYKEVNRQPQLEFIDELATGISNTGEYVIMPQTYRNRENILHNDMQFGFIQINLTETQIIQGHEISSVLWSRPIPLAWYFAPQWERLHGQTWQQSMCNNWIQSDRTLKNFTSQVWECPCILEHALLDKGRFMPDPDCDKDVNPTCTYHKGAVHCVRSGTPSANGSGQQCCYDWSGNLMLSQDVMWGSKPQHSHDFGITPFNEVNKIPSLSHWFHDIIPFYQCCLWQEEESDGCEHFRVDRRPSQDCVAYQSPGVAGVFGDPHVVTFDDLQYTFNGKGEYVLVRVDHPQLKLDVQGRFEQVPRNIYGQVNATQITSVVAASNNSVPIEIRLRPQHAQWRYRLDVFADGKRIYFDRPAFRVQYFKGVTVYQPMYILNQSEIVILFPSGAGVEVVENKGYMSARVYLPGTFMNQTRGLFGNWSHDVNDDFAKPDGTVVGIDQNNFQSIHTDFAQLWQLADKEQENIGLAMFIREYDRTAAYYNDNAFTPNFKKYPEEFTPNVSENVILWAKELCQDSYQCQYDYAMTINRDMAESTKNYLDTIVDIKEQNAMRVISCGYLKTPRFGRKSNFLFTPGTMVSFECKENFILTGDRNRVCEENGQWNSPEHGYTECSRPQEYSPRTLNASLSFNNAVIVPLIGVLLIIIAYKIFFKKKQEENVEEELMNITSGPIDNYEAHKMDDGSWSYKKAVISGGSEVASH